MSDGGNEAREKGRGRSYDSGLRYNVMFDSVADGITVTDLDGVIIDLNEASRIMNRCKSKEDLIGKPAFELISPEDRARAGENLQKTLREGA
ncbi:MAG TPA: PAS domain-containing protein, partial [bacterium]|nr:PAS domain-containing protein [bacterium]